MRDQDITLGCDPEVFVEHGNNDPFYAFHFLPSKYEPLKTEEGLPVYWDGFQGEFQTRASTDIPKVLSSIRCGLKAVLSAAKKKDASAHLSTKTVIDTPASVLEKLNYEWIEFGCLPSFNVYGISGMGADPFKTENRFAGGHIHFGFNGEKLSEDAIVTIVKVLDAILGVVGVSLFENIDNPIRRQYYGLASEHRLPPWGLEYRVLSDAWIFHPALATDILNLARKVVIYALSGQAHNWQTTQEEVIETILCCDASKARGIIERNKHCFDQIGFKSNLDLFTPIEKQLSMTSIEENWGL
jgi:hypothetical protein